MTNLKKMQYQEKRTQEEIEAAKPDPIPLPFVQAKEAVTVVGTDNPKHQETVIKHDREIKKLTNQLRNAMLTIRNMENRIKVLERERQSAARW